MQYSLLDVQAMLDGEELDFEQTLDLYEAIKRLPEPDSSFLLLVSQGVGLLEAFRRLGLTGNATRLYDGAVEKLRDELNGEQNFANQ